ncbi:Mitochondrial porin [Savitreella phatthalungensis]
MSIPMAFSDLAKPTNDLLGKDFPVAGHKLEVKTFAPNNVSFTAKGQKNEKGAVAGEIEAKWADKPNGLTLTQSWTTQNKLNSKLELEDQFAKGLKLEVATAFEPASTARAGKLGLIYKRPNFHGRSYLDMTSKIGPILTSDAVVSHEGYFAGAEGSYDIKAGDIQKYSLGIGYATPLVGVSVQASNKLSIYTANYYHRVNTNVEAGGRVVWDSQAGSAVLAEVGGKYTLDRLSSVKAKVNNAGIAQLSYFQVVRPGVRLGLGLALDTQKFNEPVHKVGSSLEFSG